MPRILLCLLFCFGSAVSQAAPTINLGPYLKYAVDSSGQWTVDDARRNGDEFVPLGKDSLNMGFVQGALWIHLDVRQQLLTQDADQFVTLSKIHFRKIDYYQFDGNQLVQHQRTGTDLPFNSRSLKIPQWAFSLEPTNGQGEVLLRLVTNSPVQSRVELAPIEAIVEQVARHEFYYGMILGLLGLMALIAAILTLSTRWLFAGEQRHDDVIVPFRFGVPVSLAGEPGAKSISTPLHSGLYSRDGRAIYDRISLHQTIHTASGSLHPLRCNFPDGRHALSDFQGSASDRNDRLYAGADTDSGLCLASPDQAHCRRRPTRH